MREMIITDNDQPAILGGPKAVTLDSSAANRWPAITTEEEERVLEVLRDGDLSLHRVTRELEDDYRKYFGVEHVLAHCNGTAALLAAFFAIGLQPGDEVLVPSATHWASVVPMLWTGAVPVFCESELERLGIDPIDAEHRITSRTKAIVIVHLWGMPSKMTELLDLARRHNLKVIEDASHAPGATWRGRKCGTLGDVSVFSLQTSKLAPAGEGGMLLTNDDSIHEQAICMGDVMRIVELNTPARRLAATSYGQKTRIAPMSAAVARVQLKHLDDRNALRNRNLAYLSHELEALGFQTFLPPPHVQRVYFEYLIRCPEKLGLSVETLIEAVGAEGCEVSYPRYPLLHQQPLFTEELYTRIGAFAGRKDPELPSYLPNALPITEQANNTFIRLPSFPFADYPLLKQYVLAFQKVLRHRDRIKHPDALTARTGEV
jgi:dTDP-4-amino-4,6-dideoxygalactose transaminase